jgi:hypothetical protein
MTSAKEIAEKIWDNIAGRAGSGLDSWDLEIKNEFLDEIANALMDYRAQVLEEAVEHFLSKADYEWYPTDVAEEIRDLAKKELKWNPS